MIVLASNGTRYLPGFLESFERLGYDKAGLTIIDTGSEDEGTLNYHKELGRLGYYVDQTPWKAYDTGAYLWARDSVVASEFLFLHDSTKLKVPNIEEVFRNAWTPEAGAVAWQLFNRSLNFYDNDTQKAFVERHFGTIDFENGIFGPMFYTTAEVLESLGEIPRPTNKTEQMAMERGWAVAFEKEGYKPVALEGFFDYGRIIHDGFHYLQKFMPARP